MASDFTSTPSLIPQAIKYDPKKTPNESTKPTAKPNEQHTKETMISSQDNGAVLTSTSPQNSPTSSVTISSTLSETPVVPQSMVESIIQEGFPALAKTTKPIPASVFSYRFASSNNNQTPYYISSDIVLSGGIAQQTRRRIVHNEVERRRKDKINHWITKLAEVIPKCAYGKQSKNIVLENALEYFSEVNQKLKFLEESQQDKNQLELEHETLQKEVNLLQDQNTKLIELLEKNKISIPESLRATPQYTETATTNTANQPDNTYVTWSAPENIPTMSTSSCVSDVNTQVIGESEMFTSPGLFTEGVTRSVQQAQPNYSIYTVSSIMNGLSQGMESLVDSTMQNSTVPIAGLGEIGPSSTSNMSTAVPIVVTPTLGTQTPTQYVNLNTGTQIISVCKGNESVGQSSGNMLIGNQGSSQGVLPMIHDTSVPQAVTQLVLCQGTVPQSSGSLGPPIVNVPNRTLVTPVMAPNPITVSQPYINGCTTLPNNPGLVIQSEGPIMTLGTPSSSTPAQVIGTNNTASVFGKAVVNVNTGLNSLMQAPGAVTLINPGSTIKTVAAATSNVVNGGPVAMAINKHPSGCVNGVRVIPAAMVTQGVVTLTNTLTPSVNPNPVSLATQVVNPGLVSVNVPTVLTGVGSGSIGSMTTLQPSFAPGLVSVNVPTVLTGVGSGSIGSMTTQQPSFAPGLVSVNVPIVPTVLEAGAVGSMTTQTPSFVTLKLPTTTLKPVCNTTMTSNLLTTGTTPTAVNLTPSPGTAFVIVRSTPSQPATTYTPLQSQSVAQPTSYNCVNVASTKITPSTIVQPTVLQNQLNTGTIQTPFTLLPTSTPAPVMCVATSTNSSNSTKRSQVNNTSGSCHRASKVPRNGNARKRQSSKPSSSSKTKHSKQKKPNQYVPVSITSSSASSCLSNNVVRGNGGKEAQRSSSNVDIGQQDDVLTIQNFSISSLIPSIDSQNQPSSIAKYSSPLTNGIATSNDNRAQGGSAQRTKTTSQGSTSLRLSHSIDSLTGRGDALRQEQTAVQQPPQQQQNILSFSAESLLGSGDDFVSSLSTISGASNNTFTPQNTFTISTFQDTTSDGSINQNFSNFSAEALISESDLLGISNDSQSSRTHFAQGAQGTIPKTAPNRTQMFSDFSAESLINSSDLGSGLSYAIDNLISRSDNNENSIAMATVNPNLLHCTTSNLLQDNSSHSMFTHSTAMPVVKNISTNEYQNTSPQTSLDCMNLTFSKYGGFTSPQKQPKEVFPNKLNGTASYSVMTTSPTYLKHSVDSITASQHNAVTSGGGMFGSALGNTLGAPSFNSLYSMDQMNPQQYQVTGNPFTLSSNLNRTSFQGPTMGSFA